MPICHKVSIKDKGQGHRNKKLAQNVFCFHVLSFWCKIFCDIVLYLVFINITTMPFKLKKQTTTKQKKKKKKKILPFKVNVRSLILK